MSGIVSIFKETGQWVAITYLVFLMVKEVSITIRNKRKGEQDIMGLRLNGNVRETINNILSSLRSLTAQQDKVAEEHEEFKDCFSDMQDKVDNQTVRLVEKHNEQIINQKEMVTYLKIMANKE